MPNTAQNLISLDAFLVWEREQPERYEYAGGVVTMMTGGSAAHVTIPLNFAMALRQALRGTGCHLFGSDMKVIANDTARYPNVSATCHPVGDRDDNISHPVLVIEGDITQHRAAGSLAKEIRLLRYTIDPAIRDH